MAIKDPFDRSYEKSVNGIIGTLNSTAEKGETHIAFKEENRPVYLSLPEKLRSIASALGVAVSQGRHDDVRTLMDAGIKALDINAHHIISLSIHHDDASILDSGYPLKQKSVARSSVSLLDFVPELTVKYLYANKAIVPEAALLAMKRVRNNAVVELQVSENPNDEASWRRFGEGMYNESRVEMRGLPSTRWLYLRGRYHEKGATGHWSPVAKS